MTAAPLPVSQTAADLLAAAALIREHGLAQHHYIDGTARDINGAITFAISGGRTSFPMELDMATQYQRWHAADCFIRQVTGVASIDAYNDRDERTAAEVIAALESAAALAEVAA